MFKSSTDNIYYTGILKQIGEDVVVISFHDKKNLRNKVNEGKFLVYQSLLPASGNAWGLPKFTHDAGRVNFKTKLKLTINIRNIKIMPGLASEGQINDVLKHSNEIWG